MTLTVLFIQIKIFQRLYSSLVDRFIVQSKGKFSIEQLTCVNLTLRKLCNFHLLKQKLITMSGVNTNSYTK